MNKQLQDKCDLFLKNKEMISKTFKWEGDIMSLVGSLIYTSADMVVDEKKLKECEEILKNHACVFSEFRGNVKMPLLSKMTLSNHPEQYFKDVEMVYKMLQKSKWFGSEYKILAAMTICEHVDISEATFYVDRTYEIYEQMKQEHRWLTSDEDIPFAAMLAVSQIDIDVLICEMEKCFGLLKEYFRSGNAVQSLSHVMALGEKTAKEKCQKVIDIFKKMKDENHKYGSDQELSVLGVLSLMDYPVEQIVKEIIEADEYLKTKKGCGNFSMGATRRRMYAAFMVMNTYGPKTTTLQGAMLQSSLAIAIAIEICMIIAISTMATVSAANNS